MNGPGEEYAIHDVTVKEVPFFTTGGNVKRQTQVTMYVGAHGPFIEYFGDGTPREDTPAAINIWKQNIVAKLMATTH